jgi:CubicO group peptidase (beta-lactamase class C family)
VKGAGALGEHHWSERAPGTEQHYNGTNYYLAGLVIEKVTGHCYADEVDRRIVRPLGLHDTRSPAPSDVRPPRDQDVRNRRIRTATRNGSPFASVGDRASGTVTGGWAWATTDHAYHSRRRAGASSFLWDVLVQLDGLGELDQTVAGEKVGSPLP